MTFTKDSASKNAKGGTELLKRELEKRVPKELLDNFQIFVSRVEEAFDETKIRLLWCHDLAEDNANDHLMNEGWKNFHRLIFVSNWQMQSYIGRFNIPWSKCMVIQNAINPIDIHEKPTDGKIKLAYWSTPHRGLNILVPVFQELCKEYDNIELDVYSSFDIYGWKERDEPYKDLFDQCRAHPKINYHGSVSNDIIRESLKTTHILAYPSIWPETSCLTLMEAMSAGCVCVHSNLAALPETSANWTMQYQFCEDLNQHAGNFYHALRASIDNLNDEGIQSRISSQVSYANVFYNWDVRTRHWISYLSSLLDEPRELEKNMFEYKTK